jgi:hypothetical protein
LLSLSGNFSNFFSSLFVQINPIHAFLSSPSRSLPSCHLRPEIPSLGHPVCIRLGVQSVKFLMSEPSMQIFHSEVFLRHSQSPLALDHIEILKYSWNMKFSTRIHWIVVVQYLQGNTTHFYSFHCNLTFRTVLELPRFLNTTIHRVSRNYVGKMSIRNFCPRNPECP